MFVNPDLDNDLCERPQYGFIISLTKTMVGKVALVTGSTSGVGVNVATELAARGARVIITGRNAAKLEETRNRIVNVTGNGNVVGKQVDFESLSSIRSFVHEMYIQEPKLNILINNVGAIGLEDRRTEDNLHVMMQINYLGNFLLSFLLFPLLKASAPSRIISVSSISLLLGHIDFEHMNDVGRFSSFGHYANSKLADVLFTVEMNKRIGGSDVSVFSLDPGLIKTDFLRNYKETPFRRFMSWGLFLVGQPTNRVATAYVWLASDPKVVNSSGKHFLYCKEFYSSWFAEDAQLTRRLWEESKRLVKIKDEEDWERNSL
ncbi:retinol dehydrogenase 14-like [Aricia agestis]|uniref:retinol dehydrogenase 14-like n=1 Tax=Aricia agestis TaxID=91739 RepID=UPI001C20A9CB|nr:retinol dehydrogenase 14-like [Aricia agestis]